MTTLPQSTRLNNGGLQSLLAPIGGKQCPFGSSTYDFRRMNP